MHVHGYSKMEIAKRLGIPPSAVPLPESDLGVRLTGSALLLASTLTP